MNDGVVSVAGGAQIAYQVGGLTDGPLLLLLQGQANSQHWWDGICEGLGITYRTVTVDYRGTGESIAPEVLTAGWSTEMFADDAVAVLDAIGAGSVHVYGTSMGGRVGQMLAAKYSGRVDRLVLACTSPGGPHAHERGTDVRRGLADPDPAVRRQVLLDLMYTPSWFRPGRRSNLIGDPEMTSMAARLHLRVSARHNAYDLLPSVDTPTLVLHGDDDRMAPVENAVLLADQLPHATVQITPGGRHGFFDEFRDDVNATVTEFLAG